jgi:hypothetical protein
MYLPVYRLKGAMSGPATMLRILEEAESLGIKGDPVGNEAFQRLGFNQDEY